MRQAENGRIIICVYRHNYPIEDKISVWMSTMTMLTSCPFPTDDFGMAAGNLACCSLCVAE
jgi:hypothetical protein